MHVPGNKIFYKSKDTIYQITDFRNAKDDIEFSELVMAHQQEIQEVKIYITLLKNIKMEKMKKVHIA